jgi:hypothetical protein
MQQQTEERIKPSAAALAFATRITRQEFDDVYIFAARIDEAFEEALKRAREEERQRIFRLGFVALWREFWAGRKLRRASLR